MRTTLQTYGRRPMTPRMTAPLPCRSAHAREAEDECDGTFRSCDDAYRALTEIRLLHREVDGGRCRCGSKGCAVFEILHDHRSLESWERKQVERMKQGLPHALPAGHPDVLGRRGVAS